MKKKLCNLLYTIPIVAASFLPIDKTNTQIAKIHHISMKEADREMRGMSKSNRLCAGIGYSQLYRIQPEAYEIGYSRKLTRDIGLYSFLEKGKYKSPYSEYMKDFKDSHVDYFKISLGGMFHDNKLGTFITLGPAYTFFNKKDYNLETINKKAFKKLSFEIGGGGQIGKNLGMGFDVDVIKVEGKLYFFIPFGK